MIDTSRARTISPSTRKASSRSIRFIGCISSRRERSGRRDISNASRLRSTEHENAILSQFTRFRDLIAKNAGHDVTLENNAETFHQVLDFRAPRGASPTARRSDALNNSGKIPRYASDPDAQDAKLECGSLIKMAARELGTLNSFQEKSQRMDGAPGPPQGIRTPVKRCCPSAARCGGASLPWWRAG